MKEDVQSATTELSCPFRKYKEEKLEWLLQQIEVAVLAWRDEKEGTPEQERTIGNNLENSTVRIQEKEAFYKQGCCELNRGKELWGKLENLSNTCSEILQEIQKRQILNICCDILKATDVGPGVGVSNVELRFRDVEIPRMHFSDRVNHIHRAPGDSGQNEAERSNAAIGDALVDGGALKWQYSGPFDGLTTEEVNNLSITDLKKKNRSAWRKML